jgi:lipoprotein-anchoring transpeptidase ErfK/SrfK
MQKKLLMLFFLVIFLFLLSFIPNNSSSKVLSEQTTLQESHWFMLHRKTGNEFLYYGTPGDMNNSRLVRSLQVKTGASWSPTPLPQLLGRDYWLIIKKESSIDNPETAPYFLTLDVPVTDEWPYGPVLYEECRDVYSGENIQCDWILPGYFGLHGTGGNSSKLSKEDFGSSGCVRHSDEDISYLYNLLDPETSEIRYYIKDI